MLKELLVVGCLFGTLFGTLNLLSNMADKKELEEKHKCCGGCCGHKEDNDGCCGGCNCGCKHDNDGDNN